MRGGDDVDEITIPIIAATTIAIASRYAIFIVVVVGYMYVPASVYQEHTKKNTDISANVLNVN